MRIDSGTVWVNKHLELPVDGLFGGAKQSGIGREKGLDGLKEYTQGKVINLRKYRAEPTLTGDVIVPLRSAPPSQPGS